MKKFQMISCVSTIRMDYLASISMPLIKFMILDVTVEGSSREERNGHYSYDGEKQGRA